MHAVCNYRSDHSARDSYEESYRPQVGSGAGRQLLPHEAPQRGAVSGGGREEHVPRHGSAAPGAEVDAGLGPPAGQVHGQVADPAQAQLLVMIPLIALVAGGGVVVTQIRAGVPPGTARAELRRCRTPCAPGQPGDHERVHHGGRRRRSRWSCARRARRPTRTSSSCDPSWPTWRMPTPPPTCPRWPQPWTSSSTRCRASARWSRI